MKTDDKILKSLYATCFSQQFSPDGNLLAAGDNFGNVSLYRLSNALSAENIDKVKNPNLKFKASNSSLYSLESSKDFLICAPLNQINGWKWKDLNQNKSCMKPSFSIQLKSIESSRDQNLLVETNSLLCDTKSENKRVFAGCGSGEIFNFDLETAQLINKYEAHDDTIYQIIMTNHQKQLVSASENGEVKIWDLRTNTNVSIIKPHEFPLCSRPHLGKYINCVAIDDDNWLICGGGPRLAVWHLRSMKPMSVPEFDDESFIPNVCKIHHNEILSGGNSNRLYIHTFENKLKTEINTKINCIYDIAVNYALKTNKIMCVAGSGSSIDICSNFSYRAATLNL